MKPLNLDNRPCSPISSNCVVWQGPDISCINICNGDTVSDVVAALATELCTILDQTNVSNYDLSCLGITACGPKDFQALIQLLIEKICELQGVTPGETKSTGACPDCIVTVASCFIQNGQTTMQLLDYVQMIAEKVCALISQIADIQQQLNDLTIRVEILENTPPPVFEVPSVSFSCAVGTMLPGQPYPIDTALQIFINQVWCPISGALGTPTELLESYVIPCEFSTDVTTNPNWTASPSTLAQSITNIWIVLCDLYNLINNISLDVEDTNTIDLTLTGGVLSANLVDTNWQPLNGFDWYGTYISDPSSGSKPECRRIGNVIYFRGTVMIPLQDTENGNQPLEWDYKTSGPSVDTYYLNNTVTPSQTGTGSVVVSSSGSLQFNQGLSVIPTSVLGTGFSVDGRYQSGAGWKVATRTIPVAGSVSTILSTLFSVVITPTGQLVFGMVRDAEQGILGPSTNSFNTSPLNHVISHVTSGHHVPKYDNAGNVLHDSGAATSTGLLNREVYYDPTLAYPFSCDANDPSQVGGFLIRLDGLHAFVEPCNADIKSYNCAK